VRRASGGSELQPGVAPGADDGRWSVSVVWATPCGPA